MSLEKAMWGIFRHTGDIGAYLVYKDYQRLECKTKEEHMAVEGKQED